MISTAMDGLTRRRGATIEREQYYQREEQRKTQRVTGRQPLSDTILPIPMAAVAMSGAIFLLATIFFVYYHVFHLDDDDEWMNERRTMISRTLQNPSKDANVIKVDRHKRIKAYVRWHERNFRIVHTCE